MSEVKHTPGPWEVSGERILAMFSPANGKPYFWEIACATETCFASDNEGHLVSAGGSRAANARLIAAAPELLEALQEACTSLVIAAYQARDAAKTDSRWTGVDEKLMRYAREGQAAIAKAKGESHD